MSEARERLLAHYRETRAGLVAAIEGLSDEALSEQSVDGWSVKDHLLHIAFWDDIRASEVERISAGHASAWRMNGTDDDAINTVAHKLRSSLSAEQAKWELERSRERLLEAISRATERGLDPSLYGEAGLVSGHEAQHAGWINRWRAERGS
jgi:uncharacterized damage-inducible protein DinB